jgi:hypothetical protein
MSTWATVSRTGATRRSEEKSLKRSKASTQRHLIQNEKTKSVQIERKRKKMKKDMIEDNHRITQSSMNRI